MQIQRISKYNFWRSICVGNWEFGRGKKIVVRKWITVELKDKEGIEYFEMQVLLLSY